MPEVTRYEILVIESDGINWMDADDALIAVFGSITSNHDDH